MHKQYASREDWNSPENLRGTALQAVRRVNILDSIWSLKETRIAALRIPLPQVRSPHR
jgi:hypothetical protein